MSDDVAAATADQKVIYEQRCEDFRSLNGFLWQSPLIIMSLTGGLWFAMASFALSDAARTMLLVFAGLANLLMIGALIRLRWVMQSVLTDIRDRQAGCVSSRPGGELDEGFARQGKGAALSASRRHVVLSYRRYRNLVDGAGRGWQRC